MFDDKKRAVGTRLKGTLKAALDKSSQAIVGEKFSRLKVEDQEIVCKYGSHSGGKWRPPYDL